MNPTWPLDYKYGDRICIIGPSGSGKTTVEIQLARQKQNVVVIDSKQDPKEPWYKVGIVTPHLFGLKSGRFVWKASKSFITDPAEQSGVYESLLESGPRVIAIDEGYSVFPTRGLRLFVTQARGKRVSFLVGIQRPRAVPLPLMTEANYWIVFGLKLEDDQKRVNQSIGTKLNWDLLRRERYSFMIVNDQGAIGGPFRLPDPNA